jgi:hypothetical protein
MDYPNGKSKIKNGFTNGNHIRLENISLKDVPLEIRRREAKKPLFLTRYE